MKKIILVLIVMFFSCEDEKNISKETYQFGTLKGDYGYSIIYNNNNLYLTGSTYGSFSGFTNSGYKDVYIAKLNNNLTLQWVKQFGTPLFDSATSIKIDNTQNIIITGLTTGNLENNLNSCQIDCNVSPNSYFDAFLAKFNELGEMLWVKQMGSSAFDISNEVITDKTGNIYITGETSGSMDGEDCLLNNGSCSTSVFVAKYNNNGERIWIKQLKNIYGSSGKGLTVDSEENIYITGKVKGSFEENIDCSTNSCNFNIFISKFNKDGVFQWVKEFGNDKNSSANSIKTDSNDNLFITGLTTGSFSGYKNEGMGDIFLIKLNKNGEKIWLKQTGSVFDDSSNNLLLDNDNILITGTYYDEVNQNALLIKFDNNGKKLWSKKWGTSNIDEGQSVASDSKGNVFVTGSTMGSFAFNKSSGGYDVFITKFKE